MREVPDEKARDLVRRRLKRRAPSFSARASLTETTDALLLLEECVGELNRMAAVPAEIETAVRLTAIQGSFPAFLRYREGKAASAAQELVRAWKSSVAGLRTDSRVVSRGGEDLAVFNASVTELLQKNLAVEKARHTIRRLMVHLTLSQDELGRMLGVSGETVRRWERGRNEVPRDRAATLETAGAALGRLLRMFRPETLPQVIRRPADLFDGKRALDWVLDGRIQEAADRYDAALSYQA